MKKITMTLLMLLGVMATQIQARTIHWLTFIDTTDPKVGEIDKNTHDILYDRWINLVNATVKEWGYVPNVIDIYGNETSPDSCKKYIEKLNCDDEDIVVFYYVGHGTENTGASKFPLMLLAQTDPNKFVPLEWVHNTLKKKGARLTITIGMCCNASQGVPGRTAPTFAVNYGNTYIDPDMSECLKKMFLDFKGDLIVTSSEPGESSWGCDSQLGPTDYFTKNLIDQFNVVLPNKEAPNWIEMLGEIKQKVSNGVRNDMAIQSHFPGAFQTPYWEYDHTIIATQRISQTPTPKPGPDERNQNPSTNPLTQKKGELNKKLSYISSSQIKVEERIKAAETYIDEFSRDLVVRIMSQDGNVVVDREPIGIFLRRVSKSRILESVSVDELNMENGQINMLKVKEIYKQ